MSIERRLTDDEVALACKLWAEGASELEVAQACGDASMTTWRRRRGPGEQLAHLAPRGHASRDSGRRSEEVLPAELYRRAALVRHSWGPVERELRSRGIAAPMRPASTAPAGPFPRGHGLRVIPIDRSRR